MRFTPLPFLCLNFFEALQGQTVTISFFHYKGRHKWWAFRQMRLAPSKLGKIEALQFFKMLGSGGGNGFSIIPDFSVYAVLCVWKSQEVARHNLKYDGVFSTMQIRASNYLHIYMKTIHSKGTWEGKNLFEQQLEYKTGLPIAVLTRATIAPTKLFSFWKNVPKVSKKLDEHAQGLLFSKGIGELPLIQQATFSIWQSRKKMIEYAYQGETHREMIRNTRELQWYREEMFTEFAILKIDHHWTELATEIDCHEHLGKYSQSPYFE